MSEKEDLLNNLDITDKDNTSIPEKLTVLPLRDIIIFPNMIFPVLIGRNSSLKAVAEAVERDKFIFVTSQMDPQVEDAGFDDVYQYGTTCKIIQVLRLPNNLLKVLVEGVFQGKIERKYKNEEYLEAKIKRVDVKYSDKNKELLALMRHTSDLFEDYVKTNKNMPPEIITAFENIDDPVRKLYYAAANIKAKIAVKQEILEERFLKKQYFKLASILSSELELLELEDEIDTKIHDTIQKTQKKFYIQEQIRALQNELGEDEEVIPELAGIKDLLEKAGMPEEVKAKAFEEFEKLKKTPTMSPEYSVNRTYLEILAALPWHTKTDDNLDIDHVKSILNEDHYALDKPKDRILEYIAILNLVGNLKKQILCFVGPPGVGKTSLAKSIARALGRKFVRFSLGGVRDEAEIRGHRRTYIGAMPGKIMQSMKKASTVNPVILLDEIDKMAMDFRGDPTSALLEVLDPEQNVNFNDHYVEVDYDLSNVLFITTANVKYDIPLPLLDRMEIIELHSYLEPEKLEIAKRHIIPKVIKEYGLENFNIDFRDEAILKVINQYTREAGVRNLERELSGVLRKFAKGVISDFETQPKKDENIERVALKDNKDFQKMIKKSKYVIDENKIEEYLKAPKFKNKRENLADKVGVATGLAWTSVGGDILPIEVNIMPGAERLTLTGKLGEVMKESGMAALSYIRANHKAFGIKGGFNSKKEIHIHVPEGAIPKDGPSAGITMTLALISAVTGKALRGDVAMTGEVTLRGNVLPIGGLKEKLLAAKRMGIKKVLVPEDNMRDVEDIATEIKEGLEIVAVKMIADALPHAFVEWTKEEAPIFKAKTKE